MPNPPLPHAEGPGDDRLTIESLPRGFRLRAAMHLPRTPAELFAFFADATQLEAITPPWLHFHVVTPRPILVREGTLIDYRLRLHGLPLRWRSRISVWEPPRRFVDEQVRGPYRWWRHEHVLEAAGDGTRMHDVVDYGVPLGRALHWLVRRDLLRIFAYRQETLRRRFAAAAST